MLADSTICGILAKAVAISTLLLITGVLVIHRFQGFPRDIFLIDGVQTLMLVGDSGLFGSAPIKKVNS